MKTFECELSVSSLEALIKDLDKYTKDLEESTVHINKAIAERGKEIVLSNVPVDKGDLQRSIDNEYNSEYARVYTEGTDHAWFAEFGTGVRGKGNPHPKYEEHGWEYDFRNQDWTGYVGHKYMYRSYITLKEELTSIAKEVLKQRGLI